MSDNFVEGENLQLAVTMLMNYRDTGTLSRTFHLKKMDDELDELRAEKGEFETYTEEQKDIVISNTYLELLQRLCVLIEDLSTILYALNGDTKEFPERAVSSRSPTNVLEDLEEEDWERILKYEDLADLPLNQEEREFLEKIREQNIARLNKLSQFFSDFYDKHRILYNKHKHGNTLFRNMRSQIIDGERTFVIPYVYNKNNPEDLGGIAVNHSIYERWKNMSDSVVRLIQHMAERRIEYLERKRSPFAEYDTYMPLSNQEKEKLQKIVEKCDKDLTGVNIKIDFGVTPEEGAIKEQDKLYERFDEIVEEAQQDKG